jgi:predicted porin
MRARTLQMLMCRVSSFVMTISIKTLGDNLMKKALLPLLIASLVPAAAFADVTVYGKANVALSYTDKNVGGSYTEVVSNASRIGLKGSDSINDDLKVIYQFEYQTRVDDGTGPFTQRNIYVGLKGSGGTAMIGMFDTPFKMAQEKVDLFNDYIGDIAGVLQGETRAKNIVQYSTPAFSDITLNVAYVNAEKDAVGVDDGYSASIVYSTKAVYVALTNDSNVTNASNAVVHTADTDILRAVGRLNVGPVVLGALWETYDNGVIDEDGYMVSAQWNVNDAWALKLQNASSDMIQLGTEQTSIGADYKLSKAAKVFGYYTMVEDDRAAATRADDKYLAVGLELNF